MSLTRLSLTIALPARIEARYCKIHESRRNLLDSTSVKRHRLFERFEETLQAA